MNYTTLDFGRPIVHWSCRFASVYVLGYEDRIEKYNKNGYSLI